VRGGILAVSGICSFGAPEQGIMAVAMVQIAHSYGLPVYVNVNLTDAKLPDDGGYPRRRSRRQLPRGGAHGPAFPRGTVAADVRIVASAKRHLA